MASMVWSRGCAARGQDFCGPLLLGESLTPLQPLRRFPALRLRLEDGRTALVRGSAPLAWHGSESFDLLVITTSKKCSAEQLCTPMLDSVLLYLALLANSASAADNVSHRIGWRDAISRSTSQGPKNS